MTQLNSGTSEVSGSDSLEDKNLGMLLKGLREKKGLSVSDVSSQIKFSSGQINSLEAQNWPALPQGFVLKGLVRKYARLLGADEQQMLDLLARQNGANVNKQELKSLQSTTDFGTHEGYESQRSGTGTWIFIIFLILVIIAVYGYSREWFTLEEIGLENFRNLFN
ncbi:transcriptional regulator [Advenella faeciporci]|uniref:Transcriptional regulator n=1 Tax=Advenella faeciporci TaxID=797535 RepID=A0A918JCP0_9BURK|nr:helix-turn-helix transcriptional regulator [Advenella faeciporci]GGW74920.1 transcriptional regulator [Advenella faeciporci]